ncbi:MAG: hypothetical protein ACO3EK_11745, partial [Alphaproteobacteria bacterium]
GTAQVGTAQVGTAQVGTAVTDLSATVTALAGLGPDDVVYYAGYDTEGARLFTALRAAGTI